jgi:hypothetical protein
VHCLDDGISRRALQQRRHPLRSSEFSLSDDPSVFSLLRFSVVLGCERNQKEAWVNKTPGVQCHCPCFLPVMATHELFLFLVKCWFCGFCSLPGWKLPNSNAGWHTLTLERERRFDSWLGETRTNNLGTCKSPRCVTARGMYSFFHGVFQFSSGQKTLAFARSSTSQVLFSLLGLHKQR